LWFDLQGEEPILSAPNLFIAIVEAQVSHTNSHALAGQFNATQKKRARRLRHRIAVLERDRTRGACSLFRRS